MKKIGIIAGNRRFPIVLAEAAKARGVTVIAVAIKGDTSAGIKRCADKVYWLRLSDFNRMFEIFRSEGVEKLVMAGQISPWRLFSREVRQSTFLQELLNGMKDKKPNTIFSEIARKLEAEGFELIDSTTFLEDLLPRKGVLTAGSPTPEQWQDMRFGMELAKEVARLDIGQTVAVRSKAIVAVEGLEGTDNLIRRAGRLAGRGNTIVKVSRPTQDMRFDIPVVGLNTIKTLVSSGAVCLAIEAGKTLFIDREKSLRLAEKHGIVIAAM